ncbi:hypothetical protein, partial [Mycobacterium sp.]|uniref:alpha-amylase family glycosyl hydrolase n=1 Tax=Mycobacterium sp. TaxID=1785 RepID=UPI003BAF9A77
NDAVWPEELRHEDLYNQMGEGDYGVGVFDAYNAEFRLSDYRNRDLYYPENGSGTVLDIMVSVWTYWMAATDCDGYRIDTFKHVPPPTARIFTQRIREFASKIGKDNFLMMGEIGGLDAQAATYLDIPGLHVLELGARRYQLRTLAAGQGQATVSNVLMPTMSTVDGLNDKSVSDSDRAVLEGIGRSDAHALANRVVTSIDDHDGLGYDKRRIAAEFGPGAVIPATALLFFGPGVPCLFYGTEQALRGPIGQGSNLNNYGVTNEAQGADRYLREAMFGPQHPRSPGLAGVNGQFDTDLPGFGPCGTSGLSVFDPSSQWYSGIATLAKLRSKHHVLAIGEITVLDSGGVTGARFGIGCIPPSVVAWLRRDANTGAVALIVVNTQSSSGASSWPLPVTLGLPAWVVGLGRFRRLAAIPPTNREAVARPITRRPQSGFRCVDLGDISGCCVAVYLAE